MPSATIRSTPPHIWRQPARNGPISEKPWREDRWTHGFLEFIPQDGTAISHFLWMWCYTILSYFILFYPSGDECSENSCFASTKPSFFGNPSGSMVGLRKKVHLWGKLNSDENGRKPGEFCYACCPQVLDMAQTLAMVFTCFFTISTGFVYCHLYHLPEYKCFVKKWRHSPTQVSGAEVPSD
jgi:hypothetical protein